MPETIRIAYQPTYEDHLAMNAHIARTDPRFNRLFLRVFASVGASFMIIVMSYLLLPINLGSITAWILLLTIFAGLSVVLYYFYSFIFFQACKRAVKKLIAPDSLAFKSPITLTLSAEVIRIESEHGNQSLPLTEIDRLYLPPDQAMIILRLKGGTGYAIPKAAFESEAMLQQFVALVQAATGSNRC